MADNNAAKYDTIGINYEQLRRPDPRIAAVIHEALGGAETVLNVGAGAGSYEPSNIAVTAVEPSFEMIAKRSAESAQAIQGSAENLPFEDNSFDAAMAVLTVHHWSDQARGLAEMRRVARGPVVILTFDPAHRPWLTDYLPQLADLDEEQMPAMAFYGECLGDVTVEPLAIPHDCIDGFLYAYWRRPKAYLEERIRMGISSFWALDDVSQGIEELSQDIESGAWARRYADLLNQETYDAGYRLVIGHSEDS